MKTNLKKKVMLALLAGGMLCANSALAGNTKWYGTTDNKWTTEGGDAVATGLTLTLDADTKDVGGTGWTSDIKTFYVGCSLSDSVSANTLTILDGTFNEDTVIYGGYIQQATSTACAGGESADEGNKVIINNATFNVGVDNLICGGDAEGTPTPGTSKYNSVIINNGTFKATSGDFGLTVTGGKSAGSAQYNTVTINGGIFIPSGSGTIISIKGGEGVGFVSSNAVNINGGTFGKVEIYGGYGGSTSTSAGSNVVTITGGVFQSDGSKVYGSYLEAPQMNSKNQIVIEGGIFIGTTTIAAAEGKYAMTIAYPYQDNSVTIKGTNSLNLSGATLMGYENSGEATGATLNVERANVTVAGVQNFGKMNFTLPEDMDTELPMLKAGTAVNFSSIVVNVDLNGLTLADGDYITLVRGATSVPEQDNFALLENVCGVNELIYYTGTAPTKAKADYTIKQGNVKGESGTTGSYTTDITGNTDGTGLTVTGGTLSATSYSNNEIIIRRGTYSGEIYGAYNENSDPDTSKNNASNNIVKIYDGTFSGPISGAYSKNGDTNSNTVTINGGSFGDGIVIKGGCSDGSGAATGNTVTISNSIFTGEAEIYGGYSSGGGATGNAIVIDSGTFSTGTKIFAARGSGTFAAETFIDNSVTIKGTNSLNLSGATLMGYEGIMGDAAGATLNVERANVNVKVVQGFGTVNFTLPSGIANGDTMLATTSISYSSATINVYAANGVKLNKDDKITLIDVTGDVDSTVFEAGSILGGAAELTVEKDATTDANGDNDQYDLVITLLQDFEQKDDDDDDGGDTDQQKAPVEGMAAAMAMVNQSADLASGKGMESLMVETAERVTNTFAAITAGSSKYKTGSHVDVDGWGVLVGAGTTKEWTNGSATTYALFLEYGKGEFDTYNGAIHGDGDSENKGVGIMARHKLANNTYYEGNIRFGQQETDWSQSEIGGYETDSNYFGISFGAGHIFKVGKNELDVYGRYSYGRVGSCDAQVGTSHYDFDNVNSHRLRIGGKYNFVQVNSKAKPFVGLAWEHEFDGESTATISGVGQAPAPSMKGHTGILEAGCDWNLSQKWTAGIGANGYIGKRKGWDGMARVMFNF